MLVMPGGKLTRKPGIWRKQQDARPGSVGPGHKAATRATSSMYTEWKIERLAIVIEDGVSKWSIVPWEGFTDNKP